MQRWRADWCRAGRLRGREHPEYKAHKKVFRRLLRATSEKNMDNLNAEIDNSLELDSNVFWKHVTKRRSAYNKNSTPPGIVFNREVYRDQDLTWQITRGGLYYLRTFETYRGHHITCASLPLYRDAKKRLQFRETQTRSHNYAT